eukprot:CAMPEP_0119071264 /NCGR_PEP_ID=MMETSP1178-20130426/48550_1 /TAXON_ID=33656 /ORGANISM="unid sp, Strain CCMP2000" /LENGTH=92 /DNA_ID=CAMNT_0007053175 /DNA_START=186 /DNA_END=460 /DNA_ORIENTATION=+
MAYPRVSDAVTTHFVRLHDAGVHRMLDSMVAPGLHNSRNVSRDENLGTTGKPSSPNSIAVVSASCAAISCAILACPSKAVQRLTRRLAATRR